MLQNSFILHQGTSRELEPFPQIREFALIKNNTVQLSSFETARCEDLQIYFVVDGKFEWIINRQQQLLYPGDTALILPGQEIGGLGGCIGIGTFYKLQLQVETIWTDGRIDPGNWSHLSKNERFTLGKILQLNNLAVLKVEEVARLLQEMRREIINQEIGYLTCVTYLLDLLLVVIGRQSTRQESSHRDFPKTFMKLEQALRQNLSHQWMVEEMAAMVGLGTTTFTERVKSYTGFPPLQYLINIRISEATKLLKRNDITITDIALETGFYSSQHFSTTFKKLTGYTPSEFRKRNT